MKLFFLCLVHLLFFANIGNCQTSKILDDYIEQGLKSNLALQKMNLDLQKSIYALKEANGLFYPSITLNAQYILANGGRSIDLPIGDLLNPVYSSLNEITQQMSLPGGFPQIQNQKINFLPSKYQDTKVSIILPLINSEIYYNRKIKKEMISYSQAESNVYKRELIKEIKISYFRHLQALKVVEAYSNAKELVAEALRVSEKLVKNEMVGNEQLLRIKSEMSHIEAQYVKVVNDEKTASSYFNFLINTPLQTPVTIDSTLLNNQEVVLMPATNASNFQSREELLQIKSAEKATGLYLSMKRANWIPTISNITDLGYQGYEYKFNADQRYVMNVIDLRWNIFNGFQNRHKISEARLDQKIMETKLQETEIQLDLQQQIATNNLESSTKFEQANLSSFVSSKEYYKVMSRQFAEGQKSLLEIIDARNELTNSHINYVIAHFETLIKQAELERATASYNLTK